jgi:hypothetical protein
MLTAAMAVLATSCGDPATFAASGLAGAGSEASMTCRLLADDIREGDAAIGRMQRYSVVVSSGNRVLQRCSGGARNSAAAEQSASAGKLPAAVGILTRVDGTHLPLDLPVAAHLLGSGASWPLNEALIAAVPLLASSGRMAGHGDAEFRVTGHVASQIARQSREEFFSFRIATTAGVDFDRQGQPAGAGRPHIAAAVGSVVDHTTLLQMIMHHGDVHGATVLSARSSAGAPRNRVIAGRIVRLAPGERSLYPGYTLGFFISETALRPRSTSLALFAPERLANAPWIERDLEYGAVLLIDRDQASGAAMWSALQPLIASALMNP